MSSTLLIGFIVTCVFLAVTPGPNMALILANTLAGGLRAGLITLAGTSTGLAVLVTVAVLGMSSVMAFMASWFDVVRIVGALYLVFLGARQLWMVWHAPPGGTPLPQVSGTGLYVRGLAVSLSNPKVLLFLGAFLPQFVTPGADAFGQLLVFGVLFVLILLLVDVLYTVVVAQARKTLDPRRFRMLDGIAGGLLLCGGAVLAMARRP
ncbi:MAG: LysE family translocator [Hyphomicrobiaceae bacterium]